MDNLTDVDMICRILGVEATEEQKQQINDLLTIIYSDGYMDGRGEHN